jgi:hypothetical protein
MKSFSDRQAISLCSSLSPYILATIEIFCGSVAL